MSDIYISYSKENKATAIKLVTKLESQGMICKIAPRDFTGVENQKIAVKEVITNSKILILLLSKSSNSSIEIIEEFETAFQNNVVIIPIKLDVFPESITSRYFFNALEWVDAHGDTFDEAFEVLLEIITESTGGSVKKKETKKSKNSTASNIDFTKNKKIMIFAILILLVVIGGIVVLNSGSKVVVEAGKSIIGSWKITDYQDTRKMTPEEQSATMQNVEILKNNALLIFNDDKSFQRIGFTKYPQNGTWDLDTKAKKILLTPEGSTRKEEINLFKLENNIMIFVAVEQIPNNTGKIETVTTKITLTKQ